MQDKTMKIAELNDLCRKGMGTHGQWLLTKGVQNLPYDELAAIRRKVVTFDSFNESSNSSETRDFGMIEHGDHQLYWHIDYYNATMTAGSPDPSDPVRTTRVLTIMLAQEY